MSTTLLPETLETEDIQQFVHFFEILIDADKRLSKSLKSNNISSSQQSADPSINQLDINATIEHTDTM